VRAERLQQALQKVERHLNDRRPAAAPEAQQDVLIIQDRGRTARVPVSEVLYLKSDFKELNQYAQAGYGAKPPRALMAELEERFPTLRARASQCAGRALGHPCARKARRRRGRRRLGSAARRHPGAGRGVATAAVNGA
jgi:hypothetical protein